MDIVTPRCATAGRAPGTLEPWNLDFFSPSWGWRPYIGTKVSNAGPFRMCINISPPVVSWFGMWALSENLAAIFDVLCLAHRIQSTTWWTYVKVLHGAKCKI